MITKQRVALTIGILFALNLAVVVGFEAPTIFYMGNVVMHLVLGVALVGLVALYKQPSLVRWMGAGSLWSGVALIYFGNITANRPLLWAHIALSAIGVTIVLNELWQSMPAWRMALGTGLALTIGIPAIALAAGRMFPQYEATIRNPTLNVPVSMQGEGGGPKSPFWPASAQTNIGGTIPSDFFMDSKRCGECHKEIYEEWNSSAHHFASFNNQYYRKAIEYMQDVDGTKGSKWCAGCHDHAVFFNGRFDRPIKEQIDTPEAQNGLGCVSCHSIVHVNSTMGNNSFTIEYPKLHKLASSNNPYMKRFDDFLTYLQPGPHKEVFLKPFMKNNSEFCSACHKVHLDAPVNNYRWLRGFDDYDNWQASGISGEGARSFYYPAAPMTCANCHMPLVAAKDDPAARNGFVHSHRFPAANTALPTVNRDAEQLKTVEDFLKSGFISVDIFAASPVTDVKGEMLRRASDAQAANTTIAVGEEAEQSGGPVLIREVGEVAAPIDQARAKFKPGSTVRLDVVVRTRKIGHFFPGGTIDSFDIWLELEGRDATGKIVYWSGFVEDNGKGPVEKGAHFYKSYQLDADGNEINRRNAFQARSVLYVRQIPPGAADTAHYRVKIPEDAKGPLTFTAKLNYRKFSYYYNQYAYAGQPKPGQDPSLVSIDHDSRQWSFDPTNIPKNVSGKIKDRIPELPIVTLAQSTAKLEIGDNGGPLKPVVRKEDRERWNDWGIGLLLQGDLKGAEYAFKKVTEAEPEYADGWLNVARALIQEGEVEAAKPYVEKTLAINYGLGRAHFFRAMAQKTDGDYDGALKSLNIVSGMYPRDRVVLNQIGRILFLQRNYAAAIDAFERVLQVDPEDLQAHYSLMLAYRGAGKVGQATREEALFRRFKADEASQAITAKARMLSVEDNNERQAIHDHENGYRPAAAVAVLAAKGGTR